MVEIPSPAEMVRHPNTYRNLLLYKLQHRFHPIAPAYYPIFLQIEITTACNLKCYRCEREAVPKKMLDKLTSMEYWERIKPILPYAYGVSFQSGLGEPLLHPRLWEIVKMVQSFGVKIGFNTNGTLFTSADIEKVFETGLDSISFSIDSLKPDVYEGIRTGAKFEKVIENFSMLCEAKRELGAKKPQIWIGMTLQSNTIGEMPDMIRFAHRLGVDKVWFTGVIAHKKTTICDSIYLLNPSHVCKLFEKTKQLASKLGVGIRLPEVHINPKMLCCHAWGEMYVFSNGDVCTCPHYRTEKRYFFTVRDAELIQQEVSAPSTVMGNIFREPILPIWNNEKWKALRRGMKVDRPLPPCKACYFRYQLH